MRVTDRPNNAARRQDSEQPRPPAPITGWPLAPLMQLDRAGARGLVADLMVAGPLARQAAFAVAAAVLTRGVEAVSETFIARLELEGFSDDRVGFALRRRRAREVIAALYDVPAQAVPGGYLRALLRVQEHGSTELGLDPFAQPESYADLFALMSSEPGAATHSLRYCGALRSSQLQAVRALPAPFLVPEILRGLNSPEQVGRAIALADYLRSHVPELDDAGLAAAVRQSLGSGNVLAKLARRLLEQADSLPVPVLPSLDGLRPLRSAAEIRAFAATMDNCAATLIGEVAVGLKVICAYCHINEAGAEMPLAVLLTPMVGGNWEIAQIVGKGNALVPRPVLRVVLRRLMTIGLQVAGPAPDGYHKGVAELLGHYCYDTFANVLHGSDAEEDAIDDEGEADLARIAARLDRITLAA